MRNKCAERGLWTLHVLVQGCEDRPISVYMLYSCAVPAMNKQAVSAPNCGGTELGGLGAGFSYTLNLFSCLLA